MYILWTVGCLVAAVTGFWSIILFTATPLSSVEVLELANVLGSTKELFFDLRVRARQVSVFSLFVLRLRSENGIGIAIFGRFKYHMPLLACLLLAATCRPQPI